MDKEKLNSLFFSEEEAWGGNDEEIGEDVEDEDDSLEEDEDEDEDEETEE